MNSHRYAQKLHEIADFLLSRPEFDTDGMPRVSLWFFAEKEKFLTAVRALGSGKKVYERGSSGDLRFIPSGNPIDTDFSVYINRSAVCRKVQEEKWECEPLLGPEEEELIGVAD
jgi:hypothetical protein